MRLEVRAFALTPYPLRNFIIAITFAVKLVNVIIAFIIFSRVFFFVVALTAFLLSRFVLGEPLTSLQLYYSIHTMLSMSMLFCNFFYFFIKKIRGMR